MPVLATPSAPLCWSAVGVLSSLVAACSSSHGPENQAAGAHPDAGRAPGVSLDASFVPDADLTATVEFLNLRVEEITARRAVVRFETSIATSCEVEYGTDGAAPDLSATDPNMRDDDPYAIDHQVPLEDLEPGTTYFFNAKVITPAGETFRSAQSSFVTLAVDAGITMDNAALLSAGARVTAVSSNFGGGGNDSSWGAHQAFDGSMATEWATAGDGDGAFVEVELAAERSVAAVGFRSRKMADGTSIITSFRLVVDGGETLGPFDAPNPDERYQFSLSPEVVGRVFRLEAVSTTGGNAGAKEIELLTAPTN